MSSRIDAAYEYCREITRREASSFYYGFLLLPPAQRRAIYSAYAFARQCDDLADGDLPRDEAERALDGARDALDRSLAGDPDGPVFEALGRTIERYDVPLQHFIDLIDGVRTDLTVSRYATFTDLRAYCYRVASSVGLISIEIFGYSGGQRSRQYATDLGIALQLTNILRDVAEDADRGRVYLPQEEVEWFGYSDAELLERKVTPEFRRLIAYQVHRAREFYASGRRLLPHLPVRARACGG
ncbi:MAG: phytoene/squalene synthase family protein, partial [Chloroflexi bacterium]|nr:phytoene/squalene synthase family protein [Chloroflexota bacterium]